MTKPTGAAIAQCRRLVLGVLAALVALPLSLIAQGTPDARLGRSILTLLPIERELAVGAELSGTLDESSYLTVTGVRVEAYRLIGQEGDPITVDLVSDAIDGYLYLVGPGYEEPLTDDDSGGACNARINVFLPADGPYVLVVGSLGGEAGGYSLTVSDRGRPAVEGECYGGELGEDEFEASLLELEIEDALEIGVPLVAELSAESALIADGSPARAYWFLGTPGQTLTFDLESEDFDTMLLILEEEGVGFVADDDGGSGCNSRITLDVASPEPYRVVVNAVGDGLGTFTLTLSSEPGPVTSEPCTGR